MQSKRILQTITALALAGGLSLTARAQIGSGWSSVSETFKVQTSGSGSVSGNVFKLTSTSSGVKDRAEREYNQWSTGQHQFQGTVVVNSLGGDRICLKQTFQVNTGPWNMIAVAKAGHLYEVSTGATLASYTVGSSAQINTILNTSAKTVAVYINGSLKETLTGGVMPCYDKCGTYRTDSGTAPITATWTNVKFWQK